MSPVDIVILGLVTVAVVMRHRTRVRGHAPTLIGPLAWLLAILIDEIRQVVEGNSWIWQVWDAIWLIMAVKEIHDWWNRRGRQKLAEKLVGYKARAALAKIGVSTT